MTDYKKRIEEIPGVMVILPTPGTSGNRKTIVRITMDKLEALLHQVEAETDRNSRIDELEEVKKYFPEHATPATSTLLLLINNRIAELAHREES